MNDLRARTTSPSPVLRLLLVGLALVLVNLYVALRRICSLTARPSDAAASVAFTIDRLAELIDQGVHAVLGRHRALVLRQAPAFS